MSVYIIIKISGLDVLDQKISSGSELLCTLNNGKYIDINMLKY